MRPSSSAMALCFPIRSGTHRRCGSYDWVVSLTPRSMRTTLKRNSNDLSRLGLREDSLNARLKNAGRGSAPEGRPPHS
jgi:hypothetical protein